MSELAKILARDASAAWSAIEAVLEELEPGYVNSLPEGVELGFRPEGILFKFDEAGVILGQLASGQVVRMAAVERGRMRCEAWASDGKEITDFNHPIEQVGMAAFN